MTAQPAVTAIDLGEAVGKIAVFAARSLHESFPHLSLGGLVETFTRDSATSMIAAGFLAGLDDGKTPGEAASTVGTALIRAWADARLAARAQLDQQTATPPPPSPAAPDRTGPTVPTAARTASAPPRSSPTETPTAAARPSAGATAATAWPASTATRRASPPDGTR